MNLLQTLKAFPLGKKFSVFNDVATVDRIGVVYDDHRSPNIYVYVRFEDNKTARLGRYELHYLKDIYVEPS